MHLRTVLENVLPFTSPSLDQTQLTHNSAKIDAHLHPFKTLSQNDTRIQMCNRLQTPPPVHTQTHKLNRRGSQGSSLYERKLFLIGSVTKSTTADVKSQISFPVWKCKLLNMQKNKKSHKKLNFEFSLVFLTKNTK